MPINEQKEIPSWLQRLKDSPCLEILTMDMMHVKIKDILTDSCFYYCAGSDITPIIAFEDYIHSFIYCDNCELSDLDYDDLLARLKNKMREKQYKEIQKFNIDLDFLNLHKSDLKSINLPGGYYIHKPLPNGDFSLWRKGDNFICLLYLCWDDICVWRNLYERHEIFPNAICNYRPENSTMYNDDNFTVWKPENLPRYLIGHANHLGSEFFTKIGTVEYLGDYFNDETPNIDIYEKIANKSMETDG